MKFIQVLRLRQSQIIQPLIVQPNMETCFQFRSGIQRRHFIYMAIRCSYVRPQLSFIQQACKIGRIGSDIILQWNKHTLGSVLINIVFLKTRENKDIRVISCGKDKPFFFRRILLRNTVYIKGNIALFIQMLECIHLIHGRITIYNT